jgi:archaellum biogenesis ATPase FlaH
MFVIVKFIKNSKGVEMPVIIIDTHNEVLEFDSFEEAEKMRDIMEKNSDSGHRYVVKKI